MAEEGDLFSTEDQICLKLNFTDLFSLSSGYLLLAGRVRQPEECDVILSVIQKHMKRTIDVDQLFSLADNSALACNPIMRNLLQSASFPEFEHVVWVADLQRLAVLVSQAVHFGEPVLLVGETG